VNSLIERIKAGLRATPCGATCNNARPCMECQATYVAEQLFTPTQLAYLEAHPDAEVAVLDVDQTLPPLLHYGSRELQIERGIQIVRAGFYMVVQ